MIKSTIINDVVREIYTFVPINLEYRSNIYWNYHKFKQLPLRNKRESFNSVRVGKNEIFLVKCFSFRFHPTLRCWDIIVWRESNFSIIFHRCLSPRHRSITISLLARWSVTSNICVFTTGTIATIKRTHFLGTIWIVHNFTDLRLDTFITLYINVFSEPNEISI